MKVYVRLLINAPITDFSLLKKLHHYKSNDPEISEIGLQKFLNYLWYLNEENIVLTFFDKSFSEATKEKRRAAIQNENNNNEDNDDESEKRVKLKKENLGERSRKWFKTIFKPENKDVFPKI